MKLFTISPKDNVGVLLEPYQTLSMGQKLALAPIKKGETVIKYGYPIGIATADIQEGEWVHSHNMKTGLSGIEEYTYEPDITPLAEQAPRTFKGYLRPDGKVGIRNEVWIIPTVGCVTNIAKLLAEKASKDLPGNCEGVYSFPHPYGCSQLGDDQYNTQKILSGLICHPNAAGVLVLGLGCENNRIENLLKACPEIERENVRFLECQGCEDEYEEGLKLLDELKAIAAKQERTEQPVSKLVVGLKCGGSDGFSGITANPLLGVFCDRLVAQGGTTILTEVPEMFGAETLLMNRCVNEGIFDKTVSMINGFKQYFQSNNQPVYENPSPGNKDGGITTLEEKSLGCVQKGGTAPVSDVMEYGDHVNANGLLLMSGPGNDLVAASGLAAAGAQVVLFTTGRGTPFGCPVPTVKVSTNTKLAEKKKNWIDFNAGVLVDGVPMDQLCDEFYDMVIALANGEIKAKNEQFEARDLAIFKTGVTL